MDDIVFSNKAEKFCNSPRKQTLTVSILSLHLYSGSHRIHRFVSYLLRLCVCMCVSVFYCTLFVCANVYFYMNIQLDLCWRVFFAVVLSKCVSVNVCPSLCCFILFHFLLVVVVIACDDACSTRAHTSCVLFYISMKRTGTKLSPSSSTRISTKGKEKKKHQRRRLHRKTLLSFSLLLCVIVTFFVSWFDCSIFSCWSTFSLSLLTIDADEGWDLFSWANIKKKNGGKQKDRHIFRHAHNRLSCYCWCGCVCVWQWIRQTNTYNEETNTSHT